MRTAISILIMLISVLCVWGKNSEFTYEDAASQISMFKVHEPEVIEQANSSTKLSKVDKDKAKSTLDTTFQKLDAFLSIYKQIEKDPQLCQEAQQIITEFIKKFTIAIYDDQQVNIKISSRNFLVVAEDYSTKFDDFYNKASAYIKPQSSIEQKPEFDSNQSNVPETGIKENESVVNEAITNTDKDRKPIQVIASIALVCSLLALLLCIVALFRIKHEHIRINHRKEEIKEVERRLNLKVNDLKPSTHKGVIPSYIPSKPQNQPKPQNQSKPQQRNRSAIVASEGSIRQEKVENRQVVTYLYATIKAQSPHAEFFKVANENSGDKVFMLTLAHPDDDVAEFTIAPNMSVDFMNSVIIDRDTYLPSLFCEKLIDSSNPTRIEVKSAGKAKKVDGKWQVQERMAIRLI